MKGRTSCAYAVVRPRLATFSSVAPFLDRSMMISTPPLPCSMFPLFMSLPAFSRTAFETEFTSAFAGAILLLTAWLKTTSLAYCALLSSTPNVALVAGSMRLTPPRFAVLAFFAAPAVLLLRAVPLLRARGICSPFVLRVPFTRLTNNNSEIASGNQPPYLFQKLSTEHVPIQDHLEDNQLLNRWLLKVVSENNYNALSKVAQARGSPISLPVL